MSKNKHIFFISLAFLAFIYGVFVGRTKSFPFVVFGQAKQGLESVLRMMYLAGYAPSGLIHPIPEVDTNGGFWVDKGAVLPTSLILEWGPERSFVLRVIDHQGNTLYFLDLAIIEQQLAQAKTFEWPTNEVGGRTIHGMAVCPDGTILLNYVRYGLIKIDIKGNVLWTAGYFTHHSVELDQDGNIWACGLAKKDRDHLMETIVCFDQSGKLIKEWVVDDLLVSNGFLGLRYQKGVDNGFQLYHLNDVEPFDPGLGEGFFKKGDVMMSLRDANAILVFNTETNKIVYRNIGFASYQHDPDFIDGNRVSVFDNNPVPAYKRSRIVELNAPESFDKVIFTGTKDLYFYTKAMGSHQILPNGDRLLVESKNGRILMIDSTGQVRMVYTNHLPKGMKGLVCNIIQLTDTMLAQFGLP